MDIKDYWNNKIIEWEDSMGNGQNLSFVERFASYFREPVKNRSRICMDTLRPFIEGKTILELGCGSGFFSLALYKNSGVKNVIGFDISEKAINRAKKLCQEQGLTQYCEFHQAEAVSATLPKADIVIGLGFLDYLAAEDITTLFGKLKMNHFLFTFSEKVPSLFRYLHILYLLSQRCPKHFYYAKTDIRRFIGNAYTGVQFINDRRLSFAALVHNLPVASDYTEVFTK